MTLHVRDLEKRFQEPKEWQWGYFDNGDHRLRYGAMAPKNTLTNIVLCYGFKEFAEKYFETARELNAMGCAVWVMDWFGQGYSGRPLPRHPERQHSEGFETHLGDLQAFVQKIVKPAMKPGIPNILVGHSMGGHLALRHMIEQKNGIFDHCVAVAPMVDITLPASMMTRPMAKAAALIMMKCGMGDHYVPGPLGHDWYPEFRETHINYFTHDIVRHGVHNAYCRDDARLRLGGPTYGWLYNALLSCDLLDDPNYIAGLKTPTTLFVAGDDQVVCNRAIEALARAKADCCTLKRLDGAYHELFQEADRYRKPILDHIRGLTKSLKP